MVQHVGETILFQLASTNPMIKMGLLSPITIFALAIFLSTFAGEAAAQSNATNFQNVPLLPAVCGSAITAQEQQACQVALFGDIKTFSDYYTKKFAEQFSFCVINPLTERDAAFDFSANLSFLSTCLYDTEGFMLNRFCTGPEIKSYLGMLVTLIESSATGEPVATVENVNCNETHWSQGCEDGWSMQLVANVDNMSDLYLSQNLNTLRSYSTIAPCCDGFYCPRSLACMIPCPLGAQCPKANYTEGLCSPYDYQLTPAQNFTCGGANMWADLDNSNGIFCPAGFYCPSTDDIRQCDSGHYCRQGSTVQSKCFQLISCDAQATTQHLQTYGLMLIVALFTILLLIYNCSDQVMHIREKHKMKSREKAAQQVREQFNAMERWKFAVDAAKRLSRTFSRRPSKSAEEMQVLAPPGVPRSTDLQAMVDSIDEERSYYEKNFYPRSIDEGRHRPYTDQSVEEDLYEPVEVPPVNFSTNEGQGATTSKPRVPQTTSQILRYAYGQIEREKKAQNKMGWNDVILHASQSEHGTGERFKIEITFQDLSLSLKGTGKKILCNVTGKLSPGHVTAVMGPSGAGKTTFLNALAGKAYNSTTSGIVLINGKPDSIRCYRKVIGFVPQDDIVHGNLTVEENLWFSANYRLPIDMPRAEKVLVVERIIDALGLGSIRNSRVGTVEKRGISGGQRKRVNVGLEMVMAPSLLILDEPTSGLDSTSSQLVLRALRREAFVGVNVGVVLHQPSYGLFRMFDDVMFLAKGGRTVYLGPVDEVENYFSAMGIIVPERINPPDHYMDVLEGVTKPDGNPQFDPKILPIKWMRYNNYTIPEDLRANVLEMDVAPEKLVLKNNGNRETTRIFGNRKSLTEDLWEEVKGFFEVHWDDFKGAFALSEDLSHRRTPGFFRQFKLIIFRLALQRFRDSMVQAQDFLILLLTGACLGFITPTKDASLGSNNYTYVIIALSLLCMIAALRTFSNDKLQFWRESASSINRVAFFLAKDFVDHFNTVLKPVVFLSLFYFFNYPRSTFVENYIVTIALVYCVTGIAYIFAITLESGPAQLWSVFLPIIFTLLATKKGSSGIVTILQYGTYTRWALESYVITNAKRYSGVWLITRCADLYAFGYDLRHFALCMSILFFMGFFARCIALLCLLLCNRKRQQ